MVTHAAEHVHDQHASAAQLHSEARHTLAWSSHSYPESHRLPCVTRGRVRCCTGAAYLYTRRDLEGKSPASAATGRLTRMMDDAWQFITLNHTLAQDWSSFGRWSIVCAVGQSLPDCSAAMS